MTEWRRNDSLGIVEHIYWNGDNDPPESCEESTTREERCRDVLQWQRGR